MVKNGDDELKRDAALLTGFGQRDTLLITKWSADILRRIPGRLILHPAIQIFPLVRIIETRNQGLYHLENLTFIHVF